jgi:hypothetical protein
VGNVVKVVPIKPKHKPDKKTSSVCKGNSGYVVMIAIPVVVPLSYNKTCTLPTEPAVDHVTVNDAEDERQSGDPLLPDNTTFDIPVEVAQMAPLAPELHSHVGA